jgi:hypothetical protein
LLGAVVGLFGLTFKMSGDLNKKIDDKFEKIENKIDNLIKEIKSDKKRAFLRLW